MHGDGQLPYTSLIRNDPHADSLVRACQDYLSAHHQEANVIARAVIESKTPERTLKRRFKTATGATLIEYLHNLRVESAKRLLESSDTAVYEISAVVGYENASFFRRLFRRTTGLTAGQYRRMFQPVGRH